jgi:DNA-binding sugar fermentation-stimulating protein
MVVTDMDTAEALKHLQTLINVASKAEDAVVAYKILREMIGVINNVEPPEGPAPPPKHPHLRSVK